MSIVNELSNGAILSLAAYAINLQKGWSNTTSRSLYINVLKNEPCGMSQNQAESFVSQYSVVDQYTDSSSGFSATVFQDSAGNRHLAIRGTELGRSGIDWQDIISDALLVYPMGAATTQIVALYNYVQRLTVGEGLAAPQLIKTGNNYALNPVGGRGVLSPPLSGAINVVGHSLGGHLAGNDEIFRKVA